MAQIQVRDAHGQPITRINIRISEGKKTSDEAIFDYDTDGAGNKGWPIPFWPVQDYTLHLNRADVNALYQSLEVFVPKPASGEYGNVEIALPFVEAPPQAAGLFPAEAGRLHVQGEHFHTEDGQLWQWRGFSWFLGFLRFCHNDDVTPDLRWLRAHGFNLVRVFGPLPWKETPDYRAEDFRFDLLGSFFDLLALHGLRCEFVPLCYKFADEGGGLTSQVLSKTYDVAATRWNVIVELVNEPAVGEKHDPVKAVQGIDRKGVLTAYGYYPREGQSYTSVKVLDYGTIHTSRDDAWFRKARQAQEVQSSKGVPFIDDEPAKAIEPGSPGSPTLAAYPGFNYTGGKTNADEFVWHHALCSLWTSGSTLHTEAGKWGHVPETGTRQDAIVKAVRDQVWRKIDASWQAGHYTGAHLSSSPVDGDRLKIDGKDIWTYSSLHANRALSVRCANSSPQAIRGWRAVESWGLGGSIVRLER